MNIYQVPMEEAFVPSGNSIYSCEGRNHANKSVIILRAELNKKQKDLDAELRTANPDVKRVARLREIIANLNGTLSAKMR